MKPAGNINAQLEGAQWSYALRLYARPGVSKACVLLQDRLGVDVCVLLFQLFLAQEHRIALEHADLEMLDGAIAGWRGEVIVPLRALRRRLKSGPHPAPEPATDALLEQIKSAEISAEQIGLSTLAQWLDMNPRARIESEIDVSVALDRLVLFYAKRTGDCPPPASPDLRAALKTIADAATTAS
jgi:uncharacterized protein (TIGR02444 family)